MLAKLFKQMLRHKLITGIILVLIFVGGYFGYQRLVKTKNEARYVTAAVEKGTIIVSVSGSGQISVANQVDIKSKTSGDAVYVGIKNGQEVKAGVLLVQFDLDDAQKSVRDAETSLETAKLELAKLLNPADELTILQAENSLAQARESKQKAEDNIVKAYEDGFNTVANAFLELPTIMAGLRDMFFDSTIERSQQNIDWYVNQTFLDNRDKAMGYRDDVCKAYNTARQHYNDNLEHYKSASRTSDTSILEALILESYETTKLIADAIKTSNNFIDFVRDIMEQHDISVSSAVSAHQTLLGTYTSKTNSHVVSLLSVQRSFQDNKEAVVNTERTIQEKELSLAKLKSGPDELDIRAKKIAIQQKEDTLLVAKQGLADCYVYAPIDGIITEVKIKKGDSVSAGTALANIITQQKIAEISLNEIDVAKVKVGQKATLSFDALPEISISGKIIEVDTVGTVSQGVVSYGVKIALDTDDTRIKPSMSVAVDIISDIKQDVLVLPNSAIKSQGNSYYVELVETPEEIKQQLLNNKSGVILPKPPKLQPVEIGLSNDLSTEIVSGLKEGDIVVTSTINSSAVQTTQTRTTQTQGFQIQGFQIPGMGSQRIKLKEP